jgi:DNA polymerase-4
MAVPLKSSSSRSIVHLNVADFAVAVERLVDPRLAGRPVIIAPQGAARAAVHDMSEEAYQAGVRKGMALTRARRICRDAACLPPSPGRYEQAMRRLFREMLPYSPLVESGEIDGHLFVDVTGSSRLLGPPVDVAWRMYRRIREHTGLAPIWSVAPNKLAAKVASRLVKPLGEYIVDEGETAAFLSPLPVALLPALEAGDQARLHELNLFRIRQVAALTKDQLAALFGSRAGLIHDAVRGIDPSPVLPAGRQPEKVSAARELAGDTNAQPLVEKVMYSLVEDVGARLRSRGKAAGNLCLTMDYADGLRCFRRLSLRPPSANDFTLFETARALLDKAWTRRVRLRRLRLTCPKPVAPQAQMTLFPQPQESSENREAVIHAVDRIRERFGPEAVRMGRMLEPVERN